MIVPDLENYQFIKIIIYRNITKAKKYFLRRPISIVIFTLLVTVAVGIGLLLSTSQVQAAAGDIQVNFKNEFGNSFTPSGATIGYYCAGGVEQTTSSIATSSYAFTPAVGANCDTDGEAITINITGVGPDGYLKDTISSAWSSSSDPNTYNSANKFTVLVNLTNEFGTAVTGGGNETAVFNPTLTWTQATSNAAWIARNLHTSVVYDNKMWVIGGYNSPSYTNDVWYSTNGIDWTEATASADWVARKGHTSLVYDNKMWVMGGYSGVARKNDVWYSTDGINWTQATASADWVARKRHTSLVYDNKMWVIGGEVFGGRANDVWYSTDGITWTQATSSAQWAARDLHTSVVYDNKMWVMGGYSPSYTNDVWYSTDGIDWTEATASADWAARGYHTSVVYDNKMWVMGGSGPKNDLWYSTDGINWTQATASADWAARKRNTTVIYGGRMWVMGGYTTTYMNDVWYLAFPTGLEKPDNTKIGIPVSVGTAASTARIAGLGAEGYVKTDVSSVSVPVTETDSQTTVDSANQFTLLVTVKNEFGTVFSDSDMAGQFGESINTERKSNNTQLGYPVPVGTAANTFTVTNVGDSGYLKYESNNVSIPGTETDSQTTVDSANQFTLLVTVKNEFGTVFSDSDMAGEFDPDATVGTVTGQRKSTNDKIGFPVPVSRVADTYTVTGTGDYGYLAYESEDISIPATETDSQITPDSANKFTILVNLTNEFGTAVTGGGNETAVFDPGGIGDPSFGTAGIFDSDTVKYVSVARLNSTHVVITYQDSGNSKYGTAVVGTISDSSISFGAPTVFENARSDYISVTALDSTHVVIAYSDVGNSWYGTAVVGTISGDSISFGTPVVFEESDTRYLSIVALDSAQVVIAYDDYGLWQGKVVVGTISDSSISFGTAVDLEETDVYFFDHSIVSIDSTHVVIGYAYWDDVDGFGYGKAVVGTISGDTITFGTSTAFYSDVTGNGVWPVSVALLDSAHVVIAYGDGDNNSYYGTAVVGTVSGDTISFGTPVVFEESNTSYYLSVAALDSTHVVIGYRDSGNSNYGTAIVGTISGDSISFGTPTVFESAHSNYLSVAALDSTHVVIAYSGDCGFGGKCHGTAIVGDLSGGISGTEKSDNTKIGILVPVGTATSTVRIASLGEEGYLRKDISSVSVAGAETGSQTATSSANQFTVMVTFQNEFGAAITGDGDEAVDWAGYGTEEKSDYTKFGIKVPAGTAASTVTVSGLRDQGYQDYTIINSSPAPDEAGTQLSLFSAHKSIPHAIPGAIIAAPVTATGLVTATAAGGKTTVTTGEGTKASVELPANAVSRATDVKIVPVAKATVIVTAPLPAGKGIPGGYVYNYTASSAGEAVTTFARAITLIFTYTNAQVTNLNEATLKAYYWNADAAEWVALPSTVDTAANKVTAFTDHFTYFTLMGDLIEEVGEEEEEEEVEEKPLEEMMVEELKAKINEILAVIAELRAQLIQLLRTKIAEIQTEINQLKIQL